MSTPDQLQPSLKSIADGLKALGRPGADDRRKAAARLSLMDRFARLVEAASATERRDLVTTLRGMLEETR